MNINLPPKKVYNLDFWWFLYHPFFVWPFLCHYKHTNWSQPRYFSQCNGSGGVGLCCLWQNLYVMSSSRQRKGKRIEGWNRFGNGPEIFSISKTLHWRYFKIPKDTFPRLPDLWIFTGRHGDALKDDTSSIDFWHVSTCFHILQPCLNKLHFIGYHLGTTLVMKTSWTNFCLSCRCVVAFWCIEIVKWMNTLGIDAECPGWSRFHLGIWRALPLPLCWHHAVLRAPTLVVLFFTETYTLQLWYGEHVFRNGRSTGMTSSSFSHST